MSAEPSTLHHTWPVRTINRAVRTLNRYDYARIDLSPEYLVSKARKDAGLANFGDESFMPAMHRLLQAAQEETDLNPFGQWLLRRQVVAALKNRLWAQACFAFRPEIFNRKIVSPIIIVGPFRSGTTRLQRLLAVDRRFQHLRAWEGLQPAPRLNLPDHGRQERRREVERTVKAVKRLNPSFFTVHPINADFPEEELLLFSYSFCGILNIAWGLPEYVRWLAGSDKSRGYQEMANLLRLISWSRNEPEDKRWVLKAPQHMLDLDLLLKVFPDATIVFTHRDPVKTVASSMSLAWNYCVQCVDAPMRTRVRDIWLELCELMVRKCMRAREAMPQNQQLDVQYEDVNRDWRGVMRRIYDFAGLAHNTVVEENQARWLALSEGAQHFGRHRYSPQDYDVTSDDIEKRMGFYRARYSIPFEKN